MDEGITFDVTFGDQILPVQLALDGTLTDLKEILETYTGIPIREQMLLNLSNDVRETTVIAQTDFNNLELIQVPPQNEDQPVFPIGNEPNIINNHVPTPPPIVPNNFQQQQQQFHNNIIDEDDGDQLEDEYEDQQQHVYQTSRYATNFFPNTNTNESVPIQSLIEFIDQLNYPQLSKDFMETYQTILPEPSSKSFKDALSQARLEGKLVLIYLHSYSNDQSLNFCLDTLKSEEVYQLIQENYIFWCANITPDAEALFFSLIQFESFPISCIVTGGSGQPRMVTLMQGSQSTTEYMTKLINEIEANRDELDQVKSEEQESLSHRMIVQEQDLAYQESLKADKEKQEKVEMEFKVAQDKKQVKLDHARMVPEEPIKSKDSTQIVFKLPDDTKIERRFNSTDTIQTLVYYLDGEGCDIDKYQFITMYPKRTFTSNEFHLTLKDSGLHPQSILNVRDEDQ